MAEPILDLLLDSDIAMHPAVLALVSETSGVAKKRRRLFKKQLNNSQIIAD